MVAEIGKTTTHLLAQHSSLFLQDVPTAHPMYVRVETAFSPQPQARIADLQANLLALCAAPAQAHLHSLFQRCLSVKGISCQAYQQLKCNDYEI